MPLTKNEEQALKSKFMLDVKELIAAQGKNFNEMFQKLAQQSVINSNAGIDVNSIPVGTLDNFTGGDEFAYKGTCPSGHKKCMLFSFNGKVIHAPFPPHPLTDHNPLNAEQQADYNVWLAGGGLPVRDLGSGAGQAGQSITDFQQMLEALYMRQSNNRKPSQDGPKDGSTGMSGAPVTDQPGIDLKEKIHGAMTTGDTNSPTG